MIKIESKKKNHFPAFKTHCQNRQNSFLKSTEKLKENNIKAVKKKEEIK